MSSGRGDEASPRDSAIRVHQARSACSFEGIREEVGSRSRETGMTRWILFFGSLIVREAMALC